MYIEQQYIDKIVACVTKSYSEALVLFNSGLNKNHFEDSVVKNYIEICFSFFKKYNSVFTDSSFVAYSNELVRQKRLSESDLKIYLEKYTYYTSIDISDSNFYVTKVIDFIKQQEYKNLIKDAVEKLLPGNRINDFEARFEKIKGIGAGTQSITVDYFDTLEERLKRREEGVEIGISTGIKQLDDCLYHKGWASKEMYLILGAPKIGKTNSLLFFTQQAVLQQKNVIYFSCEVSANILSDRLDTAFSKIFFQDLYYEQEKIYNTVSEIRGRNIGKLIISEHPTKTLTPSKAQYIIQRKESELGLKFDMAVFDYGDIMASEIQGDKRVGIGDIFERLRRIAGEQDMVVISATQLNREGAKKAVVKETDVSEDWSKIMTADAVIGLNASDQEKAQNLLRVSLVANRNGDRKTFLIKHDYSRMQFFANFVEYEG